MRVRKAASLRAQAPCRQEHFKICVARRHSVPRLHQTAATASGTHSGRPFLSLRLHGTPRLRGMRLIPGMCPACAGRPGRAVIPVLSCTARGLSCHDDHSSRGGLLPRHFNLTCRGRRYIFCDTIRGNGLASAGPALARGVLPRGVRTFLCTGKPRSGRRPPAVNKLGPFWSYRNHARRENKAET